MKKHFYTFIALCFFSLSSQAQVTIEYLDINHVKAGILTHGDMFWDPTTSTPSYQFPQGSGLHSNFASSIWMSGYDTSGNIHVSAQTYRQHGNDYWPGPLDNTGTLSAAASNNWDKIWKVDKATIDVFVATTTHTIANTPAVILEWPAKGNVHATGKAGAPLTITKDMAPFSDVNSDGIYNALDGDYPKIKGEQALWWVFSDNGPSHGETNGSPFKMEIQAMAYACNSLPVLQNTTFYSLSIKNYGDQNYSNVRIGIWDDIDLGYGFDDYVGIDTARRMAITYNGDANDDGNYGTQLTQTGLLILRSPLDSLGFQQPLGSYMFYTNEQNTPTGNPIASADYSNYLNANWRDNQPLTNTCNGRGAGTTVNFMYPSDPSDMSGWSEKLCNNAPNDRRFIITTGNFDFDNGGVRNFDFAILNTPTGSNNSNFLALQSLADSIKMFSNGCSLSSMPLGVHQINELKQILIYPNPASDQITVQWDENLNSRIISLNVINTLGEVILKTTPKIDNHAILNLQPLSDGIYFIQIQTEQNTLTKRFVKN